MTKGTPGRQGTVCAKAQEIIQRSSRKRDETGERAVRAPRAFRAMLISLNFVPELMGNVGGWG